MAMAMAEQVADLEAKKAKLKIAPSTKTKDAKAKKKDGRRKEWKKQDNGIDPMDHKGLVTKLAVRYLSRCDQHRPIEETDEYQDGFIGLMEAVDRFDSSMGFSFTTYAYYYIRAYILRAKYGPRRANGTFTKRMPAKFTDLLRQAEDPQAAAKRTERVVYDNGPKAVENRDLCDWLVGCLSKRERFVVEQYFSGLTLTRVGEQMCPQVGKERVRQILAVAIDKMWTRADGRGYTSIDGSRPCRLNESDGTPSRYGALLDSRFRLRGGV